MDDENLKLFNVTTVEGVKYQQVSAEWAVKRFGAAAGPMLLAAALIEASHGIDLEFAKTLDYMTRHVSVEERDTWPRQTIWAERFIGDGDLASKAKLEGMLTQSSLTALGDNAASYMAGKIIEKVDATDALIVAAVNFRSIAREMLSGADTLEGVGAAVDQARAAAQQALAAFKAAHA